MDNGLETKVAFGDFMQAFEAFKEPRSAPMR
jgi:hypothetical protein